MASSPNSAEVVTATAPSRPTNSVAIPPPSPRCAYVTFFSGHGGDSVDRVVGTAKALRKVKSKYHQLVVAVLRSVPEELRKIMEEQGCIVKEIDPVPPPNNLSEFAKAKYVRDISKIRIFDFLDYRKMIFLGTGIQVVQNIDDLFDMPDGNIYAVMDCCCADESTIIGNCPYKEEATVAGPKPIPVFNTGMFVFEPNHVIYEDLLKTLEKASFQDLFNWFFREVLKPILPIYNLQLVDMGKQHPTFVDPETAVVVNYDFLIKSWKLTDRGKQEKFTDLGGSLSMKLDGEDVKIFVDKWWEVFNDESLDYTNYLAAGSEPFLAALMAEVGGARYLPAPPAA